MVRRTLAWLLVTPIAAAGVLAAHAVGYTVTRTDPGPEHGYLDHAPQVVGLLVLLALFGLALQERSLRPYSASWVAPLAPLAFVCQEHFERLAHTGAMPWILTTPTFLVGLALQLPVALVCVVVVRLVVGRLDGRRRRSIPPLVDAVRLPLPPVPVTASPRIDLPRRTGRAPPLLAR